MLAGVLHGPRDVRVEKVETPAAKPDQVQLRVRRAGICGSDLHYFSHGYCGKFVPTRPFVLGHEFVGTVEAVGAGVTSLNVGDRVVVNPAESCGHCEPCKAGRANLCPHVVMLGSASTTPPTDGGFAEYIAVSARQCHRVPNDMSDAVAALMEPLSVALHALSRAGDMTGARVLISGGGPIGLIVALAARALGASLVVISEPLEGRRDFAKSLHMDGTLDPAADDCATQALELSDGGFDVVFEASGAAAAVRGTLDFVRRGGTIVQIGTLSDNHVSLPVNDIMAQEISFLGTFRYADEFAKGMRLVAGGRLCLDPLVTGVFPLTELTAALNSAGKATELKVQLLP
jgi:L-idonate 5-dehydrogenase